MSTNHTATRSRSSALVAVLAALVAAAAVLLTVDVSDGVRYGVGGVVLVALVAVVAQLARQRRD